MQIQVVEGAQQANTKPLQKDLIRSVETPVGVEAMSIPNARQAVEGC
jgi:hypothetical protein